MESTEEDLKRYRSAIAANELFMAYTANVDAIVHVDDEVEEALGPPNGESTDRLDSPGELATAIADAMSAGVGATTPLTEEFSDWLHDTIEPDERRLGGQAGISADVTASIGADPILYTYLLSREQRDAFTTPNAIRYPVVQDEEVDYRPLSSVVNADQTKINWIFEFSSGESHFGVEAASDSRFIATARPERFNLETGPLDTAVDQVAKDVDGAILAGFHSLKNNYADGTTALDKIPSGRRFIERIHEGSDIPIQVEYAVAQQEEVREAIAEQILSRVDALGVDTPELHLLADDFDVPGSSGDIIDMYERGTGVRDALGVDCLKIHAKEFFIAIMDEYRAPEHVKAGFDFATMVAATKASLGTIESPGDLRIGAQCDRPAKGLEAVERLARHVDEPIVDDGIKTDSLVVQPNRVVPNPVSTVGIGDAVSATSFLLETALANE